MTKWPVLKQEHRTAQTRRTTKHNGHLESSIFVCFGRRHCTFLYCFKWFNQILSKAKMLHFLIYNIIMLLRLLH